MVSPNVEIKYTQIFINNEFVNSINGKKLSVINPVNEKVIAEVSEGDVEDINKAVRAAKAAFARGSKWRTLLPMERATYLYKLADLIERDGDYLISIQSLESGKPLYNSLCDVYATVQIFRYCAGWCDKIHGITLPSNDGAMLITRKEPIGVAGQITPWNAPVIVLGMKWAPALAAGCTIVLKPAEQTPLTALYLAALSKEAGFPPGVINVVPGYGPTAGAALAEHPDVMKIAFTGSVEVGKKIMVASGNSNLKKVSLELGGKSPLVIFDDVNVDEAAAIAHEAIYKHSGQICFAASRVYVHSKIHDKFVKKSRELALQRKIGDPFDPKTKHGPQIDRNIFDKVMNYIQIGIKEGATLVTGGERHENIGFFIKPTIFSDVTDDMTIAKEEIFGPVQSILKFDDMEDVIKRANNTTYGLGAGVLTNDINKALKFAQAVESGSVWVNQYGIESTASPFGGYKQSGIGREQGLAGVEEYLQIKSISIKLNNNI